MTTNDSILNQIAAISAFLIAALMAVATIQMLVQ
jgi:hypothetical protein